MGWGEGEMQGEGDIPHANMAGAEANLITQFQDYLSIKDPIEFFKHVKVLDATTNQIIPYEM